ncbi:MAG: hypothetical protein IK130_01925 [Oscillospiraceae bacterium]|nr:hypothetical protein [Oscillospiraceae bacterium]
MKKQSLASALIFAVCLLACAGSAAAAVSAQDTDTPAFTAYETETTEYVSTFSYDCLALNNFYPVAYANETTSFVTTSYYDGTAHCLDPRPPEKEPKEPGMIEALLPQISVSALIVVSSILIWVLIKRRNRK